MKNILFIIICLIAKTAQAQVLVNVSPSQNIIHYDVSIDEGGVGVSFFDFDNDGWDDLTFIKQNDSLVLYKNIQGIFTLLPSAIATPGEPKQALWVDYDNDGFNDLLITNTSAPCRLYHNDGNFNFADVTVQSGLSLLPAQNTGASFGDFNKDGYLDLYLCRYVYSGNTNNPQDVNALYKNNGNGTFTNVANSAGVNDSINTSFQAVWLDFDQDGWTDIYVINDQTPNLNSLYKNNGDETFTNVSVQSGTTNPGSNPMTNSVADFDNDGDLDIFMTGKGGDVCRLLVNNNNGTFTESATSYALNLGQFFWGAVWVDLDNDTYQDLFIASDVNALQPGNYEMMSNLGTGFVNSPQNISGYTLSSGRGVAQGDFNNDGNPDLLVSNKSPNNSFLWRNYGTAANHYIKISLEGTVSNKMAIGSWIKIYVAGQCLSKYTFCGENYMGQNSQHYNFGIGIHNMADSVLVIYPSGIIDRYYNVIRNSNNHYIEGETFANNINYNGSLAGCVGDSVILNAGIYNSYLWSNGATTQYLTVSQSGSYWVDVVNQQGSMIPSDTVLVYIAALPQISITNQDISCFGLNDGSIVLDVVNQTNDYTIQWNQGSQGDTLNNLVAGNYVYVYNDIYGCTYTDSINIYNPFALNVLSQITPYSASDYGAIYSIINGGTAPYEIYLNNVLQGTLIDSLLPGFYYYEVYDANGCNYADTIEIVDETMTSVFSEKTGAIKFQNPMVGDYLFMSSKHIISAISVYNSLGQIIPASLENNILHIEGSCSGIIYLKVVLDDTESRFKVLKM